MCDCEFRDFVWRFSERVLIDLSELREMSERMVERDERGREIVYVSEKIFLLNISGINISIIWLKMERWRMR